ASALGSNTMAWGLSEELSLMLGGPPGRAPNQQTSGQNLSHRRLALQRADDHDAALWIGLARDQPGRNVPIFSSLGQFCLYILAFGQQSLSTSLQQRMQGAAQNRQ